MDDRSDSDYDGEALPMLEWLLSECFTGSEGYQVVRLIGRIYLPI